MGRALAHLKAIPLGGRLAAVCLALALALFASPSNAGAEEALLTLSNANAGNAAPVKWTRDDLAALPQKQVQTATEWTDGRPVFEGPLARDVIAGARGHGEKFVKAIAVNDYSVEIPLSDFEQYDVILALSMNGQELSLRDKGPIWIVYPRDQHEELQDPVFNSRWIWQLDRLVLR